MENAASGRDCRQCKVGNHRREDLSSLDAVRVQYLGKQGELTGVLKGLGKLPAEERPLAGKAVNEAKRELEGLIVSHATS